MGRLTSRKKNNSGPPECRTSLDPSAARRPPRLAKWLLSKFSPPGLEDELQGDLLEMYAYWLKTSGVRAARWRYGLAVLQLIRPLTSLINKQSRDDAQPSTWQPAMIRNYVKIAWRNLLKNQVAALINILGLALGLMTCLLITAYVVDELTYDRFHQNADRIVLLQQFEKSPNSGGKFASDFRTKFAMVENSVRLTKANLLVSSRTMARYEPQFCFADSMLFTVFSFPLALGDPKTALTERNGVVLSSAMARLYFPNENPLGKTLTVKGKTDFYVTGVLKDIPTNSHLQPDFLASYAIANDLVGYDVTTNYWGGGDTQTYLLLAPNANIAALQAQFPAYVKSLNDPNAAIWKLNLVPLRDLYLRTNLIASGRLTYVYIFSFVALLILGLACFNYINLATARAGGRAREVGVRKVLGSSFGQLWRQFMGETALYMLVAVGTALLLVALALPVFNEVAGKQFVLSGLLSPERILALLVGSVLVCLLAGAYPAFLLSTYRPIAVLKSGWSATGGKAWLRKALVVSQFAVSIGMIVATVVVYAQIRYVQHKQLGYQRDQILTLSLHDSPTPAKLHFKAELLRLPDVASVTQALGLPGSGATIGAKLVSDYVPKGAADAGILRLLADADYLRTFGIRLVEGRNLDPNRPADKRAFLVNQAAMRYFGWRNLTGKMTGYYSFDYDPKNPGGYREMPQRGEVVGVIKDYNHADLKQTVAPMIISLSEGWESQMAVRLRTPHLRDALQRIEQVWQGQFPDQPFDYRFLDDTFNRTYQTEVRTGQVFGLFALLAVAISCLGLFGLAMFLAEQRTKEIGVRKVLGATVGSIVALLSKDFLTLVLLALVIASPIAWYAMNRWLQGFAYRIQIEGWVFALAGLIAISIALLTVGFQSVKAALMNPVKSLRSE